MYITSMLNLQALLLQKNWAEYNKVAFVLFSTLGVIVKMATEEMGPHAMEASFRWNMLYI